MESKIFAIKARLSWAVPFVLKKAENTGEQEIVLGRAVHMSVMCQKEIFTLS